MDTDHISKTRQGGEPKSMGSETRTPFGGEGGLDEFESFAEENSSQNDDNESQIYEPVDNFDYP